MATDAQYVIDNTPDDREDLGFSDTVIADRLKDDNKHRVAEVIWRKKAQQYLELVNTSESGSSRGNDALYSRAVAEAERLDKLATAAETTTVAETTGRLGSIEMERA